MRLTITIDCDNAAFDGDSGTEDGAEEVCRILRSLADDVGRYGVRNAGGSILDINGNKVGKMEVRP